ncbi:MULTISPECIES: 3-oxoacyl-ACP synthase III family protein [Streptomyces]|uniref:3-oxoacyl-ACP synthase III family protein n=1 Tax=Streptomyces TaxID=1883 RepID=UPI000F79F365|nr:MULTISPECIES: ketoacyl-ACP synthase III [Streptomyces]RST05682.1 ketoacyl-ACP synthase III [Streptomyces sp. WAC07149]GLX22951.1 3-oxoacyl-[acyl-carrier-protein] synthase 3 [Streptomyces lavendulae subsp. lavendulae]GLX30231.1 3-oxoacyl-[acyl-carrier-protein] synthase 3 [Streptomyces lavendulae subsp. lavendulae]
MNRIGILATGSYLPSTVVGNEEVARGSGVTEEWIVRKTGIRERRRADDRDATSDLAARAARAALEQAGVAARDVAYIVLATSTPDHPQPATASIVQHLIGAENAAAFDINAVCSGFVYATTVAERLLRAAEPGRHALVIGADIYSRILDHSDPKTAILFGDGAGAVLLGTVAADRGIRETSLLTRGDQYRLISVPAGGSRMPASDRTLREGAHFFRMDGRGVRSFVQDNLPGALHDLLAKAGARPEHVRHFVPHQANAVMLGEVWPALGLSGATMHLAIERYGNTGSASVPVTLDLAHREGLFADGDSVLLAGFGGGMTVGAVLADWAPTACARPRTQELAAAR